MALHWISRERRHSSHGIVEINAYQKLDRRICTNISVTILQTVFLDAHHHMNTLAEYLLG